MKARDSDGDSAIASLEDISVASASGHEQFRAIVSISGMTCSSCVASITHAIQSQPWVVFVDVNLLTSSASVVYHGKSNGDLLVGLIDDAGFDATLDRIENLTSSHGTGLDHDRSSGGEQSTQRTVAIRIEGMYCKHCVSRAVSSIENRFAPGEVNILTPPTESSPIMVVQYVPKLPMRTIRSIISAISSVDPAFEVSVYHPPTVEDRAREMHSRERKRILFRLALCVVMAVPTFVVGILYMSLVSEHNTVRMWFMGRFSRHTGYVSRAQWILFMLATPIYFFAADVFHRKTFKEVKALWRPGSRVSIWHRLTRFGSMNMLLSLGTSIAYLASIAELALSASGTSDVPDKDYYYDTVVFLTMFILAGRYLEAYSKAKTGDAVNALSKLRPAEAILVDAEYGQDQVVRTDLLEIDDVVRIHHGSSPPFDGTIVEGSTKFDESSLTGESRLVEKNTGDPVYSGTINQGAPTTMQLTTVSGTSMLDQIIQVVREGQTRRAPVERIADKITSHFVSIVVLIAVVTWLIWLTLGLSGSLPDHYRDSSTGGWPLWSLRFAIAVFVVACPCGIGLAAPTALFVGGQLAARHGILVKGGGEAFQEASRIDCIVFDKTGTLTEGGSPSVTDHYISESENKDMVLNLVHALEEQSSHPIAKALASFCNSDAKLPTMPPFEVTEIPGKGLEAIFSLPEDTTSQPVAALIGNEALLASHSVPLTPILDLLSTWQSQGKSIALLALCHNPSTPYTLAAAFAISDPLRPSAAPTIAALKHRGIEVYMLSGDNPTTARAVGAQLAIHPNNIFAGVLPSEKADKIAYLQATLPSKRTGRRAHIAFVGDGINDAPALTRADVSIAIGSGSAVALASAGFVLLRSDLAAVLTLVRLSRVVLTRVKWNFAWALVYNCVMVPVAAGGLYAVRSAGGGAHVRLDPVWASLAMAASSLSVVGSSALLATRVWGIGWRGGGEVKR
ncbi:heavy metal translocatin [Pseudovirgaria hyperparasitica]|uniref:Heavy metal translocatin n=1 Tax=Pseudovirgaria hyperparasitica TaxID=470096 RepID=A0A6A6W3C9_9PEZI|nr:heavy metal translocatin [Pseudovirgaria hyperparasitica]KAF2756639.1 heavy metal translocatin [Pseudovirgaria hyperparasitica]